LSTDSKKFAVGDKVVFADKEQERWQGGIGIVRVATDGHYDVEILELPPLMEPNARWEVGSTMTDYAKNLKPYVEVEAVAHPAHYGGDTTYEVIKVAEAWELDKDAYLFNVLKYIGRAGKKSKATLLEDLKKALWYLQRKIARLEEQLSQSNN
jgi:hypothetical protein